MDMSRECHVNVMEMTLECHWNIMGISWKCNGPGQQSSNRAKSRKLYIEDMAVARKSVGKKPSWLAFHTGGQTSWTCGPIISCSRGMLPVQASCSNMNPKSFKIAVGGPSKYDCKAWRCCVNPSATLIKASDAASLSIKWMCGRVPGFKIAVTPTTPCALLPTPQWTAYVCACPLVPTLPVTEYAPSELPAKQLEGWGWVTKTTSAPFSFAW